MSGDNHLHSRADFSSEMITFVWRVREFNELVCGSPLCVHMLVIVIRFECRSVYVISYVCISDVNTVRTACVTHYRHLEQITRSPWIYGAQVLTRLCACAAIRCDWFTMCTQFANGPVFDTASDSDIL